MPTPLNWLGLLSAPLVVIVTWLLVQALVQPPTDPEITAVERATLIDAGVDSDAVVLPHDWRYGRPDREALDYRIEVFLETLPAGPLLLFIPRVVQNAALFIEPGYIAQQGRMDTPLTRNARTPLLLPIAGGLLHAGSNTMTLRVRSEPAGSGYLGPLYIGPAEIITPVYQRHWLARVGIRNGFGALTWLAAGVLAVLVWLQPQVIMLRWLLAATGLWAVCTTFGFIADPPLHHAIWRALLGAAFLAFMVCTYLFTLRFFACARPRLERAIVGLAGVLAAVLLGIALTDPERVYRTFPLAMLPMMVLGVIVFGTAVMAWRRGPTAERFAVLYCAAIVMLLGAFDFAIQAGLGAASSGGVYATYATPFLLLFLGALFVRRFLASIRESDQLRRTLEQRVALKSAELAAMERERTLSEERERIMRDMHDGVGGYLVSTLALIEHRGLQQPELTALIEQALLDLRLMIDSLDEPEPDLASLLGALRAHLDARLPAAGIQTRWQVAEAPELPLNADEALSILRIMQEAFTNAVKHSGAANISVSVRSDARAVTVQLTDDGHGFSSDRPSGRGLINMRKRAERNGFSLAVVSGDGGTTVTLTLPGIDAALRKKGT